LDQVVCCRQDSIINISPKGVLGCSSSLDYGALHFLRILTACCATHLIIFIKIFQSM
jgi:hypothetical protein